MKKVISLAIAMALPFALIATADAQVKTKAKTTKAPVKAAAKTAKAPTTKKAGVKKATKTPSKKA